MFEADIKTYLDFGYPFISSTSIGGSPCPLTCLITDHHIKLGSRAFRAIPDKVALLLTRGADISIRESDGDNFLHIIMATPATHGVSLHSRELKDILMLLVTAGADVYAVNDYGVTVSQYARQNGYTPLWYNVLKTCGYDVKDVCQESYTSHGWSSSVDVSLNRRQSVRTPKLSFSEYLEIRKVNGNNFKESVDCDEDNEGWSTHEPSSFTSSEAGDESEADEVEPSECWEWSSDEEAGA
jgi:hypothetical protein